MKIRHRRKLLIEPPSSATGDIAFNLIVFFLVCASVQPDSGRKQSIPNSEEVEEQKFENVEVHLQRSFVIVNGDPIRVANFDAHMTSLLKGRTGEDRIVIVKSEKDVPYRTWIDLTSRIEDAGGVVTLQLEEEREVIVP